MALVNNQPVNSFYLLLPMRFGYALPLFLGLSVLGACRKEVVEPDPNNKLLPKYTETGRNTGGAMINGQGWRTYEAKGLINYRSALVVKADADSVSVIFDGNMLPLTNPPQRQELEFTLRRKSQAPFTLDSLLSLHNRRFGLDGRRHVARMDPYGATYSDYAAGRGELYVRRVQKLVSSNVTVNGQPYTQYVLSGTFHFTAYSRTDSVRVSEGRFDHRIERLGYQ
jgi:hypothetical protein